MLPSDASSIPDAVSSTADAGSFVTTTRCRTEVRAMTVYLIADVKVSEAKATASAGDDGVLIFEAHQFCSIVQM
jgi:hypothetical protein